MANTAITSALPYLNEVLKVLDPDGGAARSVGEVLTSLCPALDDIPWYQGNMPGGHRIRNQYALPSVAWRGPNEGIGVTFGQLVQYDEQAGEIAQRCEIDRRVAGFGGPAAEAEYVIQQNRLTMEKMAQTLEDALFYSSLVSTPKQIHGLAPRYARTSGYTASSYVLAGTTLSAPNVYSMWLIGWGLGKTYGFYPPGTMAGLKHDDFGIDMIDGYGGTGYKMPGYRDWYQWDCGFAVEDYRHTCRYQLDLDDTTAGLSFATTGLGILMALNAMMTTVFPMNDLAAATFYLPRLVLGRFQDQLANSGGSDLLSWYGMDGGRPFARYWGRKLRASDRLVAETTLVK